MHAHAMMPLINPTPNCYHRVKPYTFAPSNVSWGVQDRSALVRVKATGDDNTHLEMRAGSAVSNPYLLASAVLAAGLLGVKAKAKLRSNRATRRARTIRRCRNSRRRSTPRSMRWRRTRRCGRSSARIS